MKLSSKQEKKEVPWWAEVKYAHYLLCGKCNFVMKDHTGFQHQKLLCCGQKLNPIKERVR